MGTGNEALDWSAIIVSFITGLFVLCKHIKHSRCRSACMRAEIDTTDSASTVAEADPAEHGHPHAPTASAPPSTDPPRLPLAICV